VTISTDYGTSNDLPIDFRIPGYRLRQQVGEDRLGLWLDAEQESLQRKVTVKVLRPELAGNEQARREFLAEMERLAPLTHPNLLRVLDSVREGQLVLVVERIGARRLEGELAAGLPLGEAASLTWAHKIGRALHYLAEHDLAHRNLTPRLVALLEDEGLRLVTLRNVVTFEEMRAYKGKLFQDANYVAPEQLGGEHEPGPATPCYQLAALLFHMLAGVPPHGQGVPREIAKKHFQLPFPSLKRLQPFLSGGIYDVIAACTAKDPAERPSLEELVSALEALAEGKAPGIDPPGGPGPRIATPRSRRRRRRR